MSRLEAHLQVGGVSRDGASDVTEKGSSVEGEQKIRAITSVIASSYISDMAPGL